MTESLRRLSRAPLYSPALCPNCVELGTSARDLEQQRIARSMVRQLYRAIAWFFVEQASERAHWRPRPLRVPLAALAMSPALVWPQALPALMAEDRMKDLLRRSGRSAVGSSNRDHLEAGRPLEAASLAVAPAVTLAAALLPQEVMGRWALLPSVWPTARSKKPARPVCRRSDSRSEFSLRAYRR
jgi:hypothetical protein